MLGQVKAFMAERKVANLLEIAKHCEVAPSAAQPMVEHWIRKRCIEQTQKPTACGKTCLKCDPALAQVYRYTG